MTLAEIERPKTEVLDRLQAIYERAQADDWRAMVARLESWRQAFTEQRRQVFPPDLSARIKNIVKSHEGEEPRGPGLRYRSLAEARNAGIDLAGLKHLQDSAYNVLGGIVRHHGPHENFVSHEMVVGRVDDMLDRPPAFFHRPDPDKEKVFLPPYEGSWDRVEENQASGAGEITENSSYLQGPARMGSRLVARNDDARDVDDLCAYRENGYLVPFTTLRTGVLQVKVDLTALLCRHHIDTEDEWGWSQFHAKTHSRLVMAVFWDWEDVNPASEVSHQSFVSGLDSSGDGESFPGTSIQALPGERRIINLFTDVAFPAGRDLWVYVGLADRIWAVLNDVSIDISLDSAWLLNSLAIRSI